MCFGLRPLPRKHSVAFKQIVEWLGPHVSSLPWSAAWRRSCSERPACWLAARCWGLQMEPAVPTGGHPCSICAAPSSEALLLPQGSCCFWRVTCWLFLGSGVPLRTFLGGVGAEALGGQRGGVLKAGQDGGQGKGPWSVTVTVWFLVFPSFLCKLTWSSVSLSLSYSSVKLGS